MAMPQSLAVRMECVQEMPCLCGAARRACCSLLHRCRPDGEVTSGWASMRGKRALNEDTVYCRWHNEQGVDVGAFGVFDG